MRLYRVSNLAKGQLKDRHIPSGDAQLGMLGGKVIHAALTEKYRGTGRYLEKEQIVFLAENTFSFSPIYGMITAEPDMYWFGGTTLYVEEGKTISPKEGARIKGRVKTEGLNQVYLYSYSTNINQIVKRARIVIKIKVFVRNVNSESSTKENVENILKNPIVFTETITGTQLREKVETYLEKLLGKKGTYLPFQRAVLTPHATSTKKELIDYFCADCRAILSEKKKSYKVGKFGNLCHWCFYSTVTQAEFHEKRDKFLEGLKTEGKR